MIVWGPGYTASQHKHHCVQLAMSLCGRLRIRGGPGQKWVWCRAALVRPDAPHEVEAKNVDVLLVFVDAESDLGTALLATIDSEISPVPDSTVLKWRRYLGDSTTLNAERVEPWVREHLLTGRRVPRLHPRVRRVLQVLREEIGSGSDLSLKRMAAIAGLSKSRLMHSFTESVGVPLRPYILWLRVQKACGAIMRGATVADAAHHSGFSDSAHLTRTLKRMMGMTPGELVDRGSAPANPGRNVRIDSRRTSPRKTSAHLAES